VRLYGEMHRFIPAYASWNGALITEIPVHHRARRFGHSKYGLTRILRVLLDLATVKFLGAYSTKPHYVFGFIGMLLGLVSLGCEAIAGLQALTPPYVRMHNNPLTLLGAICLVLAVQIFLMGLLAELIMRTYHESQGKTTYRVRSLTTAPAASPAAVAADRASEVASVPPATTRPMPQPIPELVPAATATPAIAAAPAQYNGHNGHNGHLPGEWHARGGDEDMTGNTRIAG